MTNTPEDPRHGAGYGQGRGILNTGTYIGEGTFNGPTTFGDHSPAVQGVARDDLDRLQDLLGQLEDGVRRLGGADAGGALADLGRVRSELHQHPPDRPRINQLLDRIVTVVAPVGSLLAVATQVTDLITKILH